MSAYIVEDEHIARMLRFGVGSRDTLAWYWPDARHPGTHQRGEAWGPAAVAVAQEIRHTLDDRTAQGVGQMLLEQNYKSVNHRYDESTESGSFAFDPVGKVPLAVEVLKLIGGYEYQSCEDPEWEDSEAKEFCRALKEYAIRQLPGYDEAPWGP